MILVFHMSAGKATIEFKPAHPSLSFLLAPVVTEPKKGGPEKEGEDSVVARVKAADTGMLDGAKRCVYKCTLCCLLLENNVLVF